MCKLNLTQSELNSPFPSLSYLISDDALGLFSTLVFTKTSEAPIRFLTGNTEELIALIANNPALLEPQKQTSLMQVK